MRDRNVPHTICFLTCQGLENAIIKRQTKSYGPVDKYLYVERNTSTAPCSTKFR